MVLKAEALTGKRKETSGKLNDQFTTRQTAFGTILARTPRKLANPRRSEKQANMRCQIANMSANFKLYQGKLKMAWENKKTGLTEFNCFVASNYDKDPVYITKSMRVAGACVLAESYISCGSLSPIDLSLTDGGVLVSDLKLGTLQIGAGTTVADLTIAILQNNQEWEDGDQLTWFYGVQRVDSAGTPRASLTAEKVILDTTNETKLWDVVSEREFSSVTGCLGMNSVITDGAAAWIHSREDASGNLTVSTQFLYVDSAILAGYQDEDAFGASAASYGGINTSAVYLDPKSFAGNTEASGGTTEPGNNGNTGGNDGGGDGGDDESGDEN